jgi:hypothetical protein
MTIKTMGQSVKAKLFAAVVLATCVFTIAANAQPRFVGKFTLPYEVHWNHAVLPAGEYSMRMDARGTPPVVRSASSNRSVYIAVPIIADRENGGSNLLVTIRGNEHRVRSLNLSGLGVSLVYEPLTKTEREMLAKAGHLEAVPVVIARK